MKFKFTVVIDVPPESVTLSNEEMCEYIIDAVCQWYGQDTIYDRDGNWHPGKHWQMFVNSIVTVGRKDYWTLCDNKIKGE